MTDRRTDRQGDWEAAAGAEHEELLQFSVGNPAPRSLLIALHPPAPSPAFLRQQRGSGGLSKGTHGRREMRSLTCQVSVQRLAPYLPTNSPPTPVTLTFRWGRGSEQ